MSALLDFVAFNELTNWSVAHLLQNHFNYNKDFQLVKIGSFLKRNKTQIIIDDNIVYKRVKIKLYNNGVFLRDTEIGKNIGTKKQFRINEGQFLLSKIDARNGAFGLATSEVDGAIITADFLAFDIDITRIEPSYLVLMTTTKHFQKFAQSASSGTTGRQRIDEKKFLNVQIPLPTLEKQKKIVHQILDNEQSLKSLKSEFNELLKQFKSTMFNEQKSTSENVLKILNYKNLHNWSVQNLLDNQFDYDLTYSLVNIKDFIKRSKSQITVSDDIEYKRVKIRLYHKGVSVRDTILGKEIGTKKQFVIKEGQFLLSKIDARNGAFGIATKEVDGAIITADFFAYDIDDTIIDPYFLSLITTTEQFLSFAQNSSTGTTNRQRLNEELFLNVEIPLPSLLEQKALIEPLKKNLFGQQIAEKNRILAIEEFEKEVFSEA
ncbi:MAG: restriction endonuclease subunit S [Sulfurimonas sp.]|jgi:restriction endonuclease S subunit